MMVNLNDFLSAEVGGIWKEGLSMGNF